MAWLSVSLSLSGDSGLVCVYMCARAESQETFNWHLRQSLVDACCPHCPISPNTQMIHTSSRVIPILRKLCCLAMYKLNYFFCFSRVYGVWEMSSFLTFFPMSALRALIAHSSCTDTCGSCWFLNNWLWWLTYILLMTIIIFQPSKMKRPMQMVYQSRMNQNLMRVKVTWVGVIHDQENEHLFQCFRSCINLFLNTFSIWKLDFVHTRLPSGSTGISSPQLSNGLSGELQVGRARHAALWWNGAWLHRWLEDIQWCWTAVTSNSIPKYLSDSSVVFVINFPTLRLLCGDERDHEQCNWWEYVDYSDPLASLHTGGSFHNMFPQEFLQHHYSYR